jgi:phenylacetate-CoA ligase
MILASLQKLESHRQQREIAYLQSADITQVQLRAGQKLSDLLLWCRATVPAYRESLSKWSVTAIRENPLEVVSQLPVLEKATIRARAGALVSTRTPRTGVRSNSSGGSTGEPLQLLQDRTYRRWNRAASTVFESWAGFRPGQRKTILWGMPRDLVAGRRPVTRFTNRLLNRHLLDAYSMSPDAMDRYAESLRSNPPKLLRCLAQSGAELARHILQGGNSIEGIGAVMSTGGVLHQAERKQMEKAFHAPVFNLYGSREVGPVACESSPGGPMKIIPLIHHFEILDGEDRPVKAGESGDIVITLLTNRTMPLLRYRIGDRGRWADSLDDGPAWPALAAIEGRVMGHFITTDGALVNGEYFTHLMFNKPWIRKFQWVQHTRESVELKCVLDDAPLSPVNTRSFRAEMEQKSREILGPEVTLELNFVDHIKPSPSGKHHYTISKVPRPVPDPKIATPVP